MTRQAQPSVSEQRAPSRPPLEERLQSVYVSQTVELRDRAWPASATAFVRYLQIVAGAVVAYLAIAAPINVLVDAHSSFPKLHLDSLQNARSSESRIAKANAAVLGPADLVIVGSSRAIGAFPVKPVAAPGRSYLNLAVQNTSLLELTAITRFALEHDRPKTLVIGADFEVFNYDHLLDEFLKSRFNRDLSVSELLLEQAISVYALKESVETFEKSLAREAVADAAPKLSRLAMFRILLADTVHLAFARRPKAHVPAARLEHLREVILDAERRGVRVEVVMMPVHGTLLWALDRCGLWPEFENWKRDMVALLAGTRARLWDFNGFDPPQWEEIPAEQSSHQEMAWFTDASHCSPAYGGAIFSQIAEPSKAGLGVRLDSTTLEARLATVRRQKQDYAATRKNQLRLVAQVLARDEDAQRLALKR